MNKQLITFSSYVEEYNAHTHTLETFLNSQQLKQCFTGHQEKKIGKEKIVQNVGKKHMTKTD